MVPDGAENRELSRCQLRRHWSSEVAVMTTAVVTNDNKVGIMTNLGFRCFRWTRDAVRFVYDKLHDKYLNNMPTGHTDTADIDQVIPIPLYSSQSDRHLAHFTQITMARDLLPTKHSKKWYSMHAFINTFEKQFIDI